MAKYLFGAGCHPLLREDVMVEATGSDDARRQLREALGLQRLAGWVMPVPWPPRERPDGPYTATDDEDSAGSGSPANPSR